MSRARLATIKKFYMILTHKNIYGTNAPESMRCMLITPDRGIMFEDDEKNMEGKGKDGRYLPGNQLWRIAMQKGTIGKPKRFETPEILAQECVEYFEWVEKNPLKEEKVFGSGYRAHVNLMRAMTIKGLCRYIGISHQTWIDYRKRSEFAETCQFVEDVIYDQKFAGASAGLLSATIIARDLGLADQQNSNLTVIIDKDDEDL